MTATPAGKEAMQAAAPWTLVARDRGHGHFTHGIMDATGQLILEGAADAALFASIVDAVNANAAQRELIGELVAALEDARAKFFEYYKMGVELASMEAGFVKPKFENAPIVKLIDALLAKSQSHPAIGGE